MARRMVDGVFEKIKKYCGCGELLTGKRSRYCGRACYESQRKDFEKAHYAATHPPMPPRICISCKTEFTPRTIQHECCNARCRAEYTLVKSRESRARFRALTTPTKTPKGWVSPHATETKTGEVDTVTSIDTSPHKKKIADYLKSGGTVTVLAPQLDGRTPSVNIPFHVHNIGDQVAWAKDTAYGHGYELDIMDGIYTVPETDEL
jgi:hypothetical protein